MSLIAGLGPRGDDQVLGADAHCQFVRFVLHLPAITGDTGIRLKNSESELIANGAHRIF